MSVFLLLIFLYKDFLTLPVSTHYAPFFNIFQFFRQKIIEQTRTLQQKTYLLYYNWD